MSQNTKQLDKKSLVLNEVNSQLTKLITSKLDAMPKDFNQTRFIQNAMAVLIDTKGIENCKAISIARTLLKGAFLGLDFLRKECYAIPYGSELNFQTDYKGDIKLAKKYSIRPIKTFYADVVREGDFIEYGTNTETNAQFVNFKPLPFNNSDIIGAFSVVVFDDGEMLYQAMSSKEVEDIRNNFSKSKNSLMWTKTPTEAYKKTVSRRLTKMITLDFDSIEQKQAFDDGGDMDFETNKKSDVKNPFEEFLDAEFEDIKDEEIKVDKNTGEVLGYEQNTSGEHQ